MTELQKQIMIEYAELYAHWCNLHTSDPTTFGQYLFGLNYK